MIDVSRQLKPAPLSFEKTFSQFACTRICADKVRDKDGLITEVGHLNRKGQRKQEALQRRAARRAFRRGKA